MRVCVAMYFFFLFFWGGGRGGEGGKGRDMACCVCVCVCACERVRIHLSIHPPQKTNHPPPHTHPTGVTLSHPSQSPSQAPTGAEALQALNSLLQDTRGRRPAQQPSLTSQHMASRFLYGGYGGGGGSGGGKGGGGGSVEGVRAWKAEYQKHGYVREGGGEEGGAGGWGRGEVFFFFSKQQHVVVNIFFGRVCVHAWAVAVRMYFDYILFENKYPPTRPTTTTTTPASPSSARPGAWGAGGPMGVAA